VYAWTTGWYFVGDGEREVLWYFELGTLAEIAVLAYFVAGGTMPDFWYFIVFS